ncbi:hypothetical protein BC826DRAFT_195304 [Russula brevipes]|nr:hypothetical protein BC826DRAFT_195304 [Russula brevipes]
MGSRKSDRFTCSLHLAPRRLNTLKLTSKQPFLSCQAHSHRSRACFPVAAGGTNSLVVKLWRSFRDAGNLYLVMDVYLAGSDLDYTAKGSFSPEHSRFYAAEVVHGIWLQAVGLSLATSSRSTFLAGRMVMQLFGGLGKSRVRADRNRIRFPRHPPAGSAPNWINGSKDFATPRQLNYADTSSRCGTAAVRRTGDYQWFAIWLSG